MKADYHKLKARPFHEKLRGYILITLSVLILIYFGFRLKKYITGPKLTINYPLPYQSVSTETFQIKGNVQNTKSISINGRDIKISKSGDFEETLITKRPYTLIIFKITGRYGEEKTQVLNVGVEG